MTNQPVQRSTTHANSEFDAQRFGQIGGRAAGELFILHSKEDTRLALPSKIEEAKAEAHTLLTSANSDDRQAAEYWLAFYAELERHIATAKAGK
jgi:hypothetical protein